MDCCSRSARHGTTATCQESRVSTSTRASKNVRVAFPLPGKVQGHAECPDIQQVRYRTPLCHLQRCLARDCRASAGGGTHGATRGEDFYRTSKRHSETVTRRSASRNTGSRKRVAPQHSDLAAPPH